MLIGAHVRSSDPLAAAAARDAEVVQLFLSDPQGWKKPPARDDADALRDSPVRIYVHAPYLINVATPNNRIRHPSRQNLTNTVRAAEAIGAAGVIVHGGHVGDDDDPAEGFTNWRKTLDRLETDVPILIENTAGGENAMAREFDRIGQLWEALEGVEVPFGFCLDTCHAWAGGEQLVDAVARVCATVGRIDLVHLNDSKDEFDSRRDRHQNLGDGRIDPDLLVEVVRAADAPVLVETPDGGDGQGQARDIAWIRGALGG
ncbi:MAG: deoxyribonuclease IV [Actinobacteria bacterium]|nr:deoxyribonuclease IV [Actinomycetota bacterium]